MKKCSNDFIRKALEAARALTLLADHGEAVSEDDGCVVLYGIIRDCAYKIRSRAELERDLHKAKGLWVNGDAAPQPPAVGGRS